MTWFAQVRHIVRKDLLHARWLFAAYVAAVALATAHAVALPAATGGLFGAATFLILLLGMIAVASLVQSDSPTRSNAFWASRPFHPSAMLAAKLCLTTLLIIGLPMLGQVAGLLSLDVPSSDLPRVLWKSASSYALWLLAAILVGAVTQDLRTFAVALIAMLIALLIALLIAAEGFFPSPTIHGADHANTLRTGIAAIGVVGALALLMVLYRRRDVQRGIRIATFVAAACVIGVGAAPAPRTRIAEASPAVQRAQLRVELMAPDSTTRWTRWELGVLAEGAPDSDRLTLLVDTITFHLRDGSTLHVPSDNPIAPLYTPPLPAAPGVRWLGERTSARGAAPSRRVIAPRLTGEEAWLLSQRGVASLELVGRMWAMQPRFVGTVPLEAGQSLTRDGRRLRIASVSYGPDGATVEVRTLTLPREQAPASIGWGGEFGELSFALVNESRGEAMLLQLGRSSGQSDWLVLPGASLVKTSARLESQRRRPVTEDNTRDDTWYAGAQLAVVEWSSLGSYPVRARAVVP